MARHRGIRSVVWLAAATLAVTACGKKSAPAPGTGIPTPPMTDAPSTPDVAAEPSPDAGTTTTEAGASAVPGVAAPDAAIPEVGPGDQAKIDRFRAALLEGAESEPGLSTAGLPIFEGFELALSFEPDGRFTLQVVRGEPPESLRALVGTHPVIDYPAFWIHHPRRIGTVGSRPGDLHGEPGRRRRVPAVRVERNMLYVPRQVIFRSEPRG